MRLHLLENREKRGYTTFGAIWNQGEVFADTRFLIKQDDGQTHPVQSRNTAFYPDGSVKWTAHTVNAGVVEDTFELLPAEEALPEAGRGQQKEAEGLTLREEREHFFIQTDNASVTVNKSGSNLFTDYHSAGKMPVLCARPVLQIERRTEENGRISKITETFTGKIQAVKLEEQGPLRITVKFTGIHENPLSGEQLIPFIIRMQIGAGDDLVKFTHTFMYDGVEERDFLQGIGIRFELPIAGEMYNRHVKIPGDFGCFHESSAQLISWIPAIPQEVYEAQMRGEKIVTQGEKISSQGEIAEKINTIMNDMPFWDTYCLTQDFHSHFSIKKRLPYSDVCLLDCLEGKAAKGVLALGGENGTAAFAIRDFDKKTPSGLWLEGLTGERAAVTAWFYTPQTQSYDFRHYAKRGYNQVCYEGYDYLGASAYGIAVTSEAAFTAGSELIFDDARLERLFRQLNHPPLFVARPEEYHQKRAFGYWSLERRESEAERWLEEQLDLAVEFYKQEVEQRNWYGLFNYGDFMHTYDRVRHTWRYDMGGYAWDNTELVPTLWLWLMFMRSGREDVFTLAEKLSRHTAEVDVYHFGKYKGMGSRHNVRHWGCPCKEARIAMAGHHRYYYYLTGDFRFEDIFEELKDNEETFLNKDPLGDFYDKESMVYPSHARSGPDWSSLCSNWMTQWERFNDPVYRDKICVGIEDIKKAPLKLVSGPAFEFDPASKHLRYIGEGTVGGTHLQICMGAPSIWMEMADLLQDEEWKTMLAEYGRFYFLTPEEKQKESGGLIGQRQFSFPYFASAMGAYGAWYLKDKVLAKTTWRFLLGALMTASNVDGFTAAAVPNQGNHETLKEIPWISTNFTAQWCLNTIMVLDFIREQLPETMDEARKLVADEPAGGFRRA